MDELLQISIFQNRKNFTLIIQKSGDIAFQSEENIFFKSDRLTLGTPPQGTVFHTIFSGKDILRKKTSAIGCIKN